MNTKVIRKMDDSAVSPVIGVILMVAITVVLAAIVFVMVSRLGDAPDDPVQLTMAKNSNETYTVISVSTDELPYADLTITGCTGHKTTGNVQPGDLFHTCTDKLMITYKNTVIYRDTN